MQYDTQFPQLTMALQPLRMKELLQKVLLTPLDPRKQALLLDACVIGEKRYKPGKSCVLSYRLHLHDTRTGAKYEQVVSARLCRLDEGPAEFQRARSQHLVHTPGLQALAYLPEAEMIVWSFPNDRKLSHLPKLLDVEFLKPHLSAQLRTLSIGESHEITAITPKVLHYLPERSCMIRYDLSLQHRSTKACNAVTLYGKTFRDESGAEVYSIMQQLAKQLSRNATPLGYDRELRTMWQSHVPGLPFLWETLPASRMPTMMRAVARCVAEFHRCTVHTNRRFDPNNLDESLMETITTAEQAYPNYAGRIAALVDVLLTERQSMAWSESLSTPVHRDLKMGNFLIQGEHVTLIDMDDVCLGDPHTDLGSLIANFHLNGIRAGWGTDRVHESTEVFVRAYTEHVPWNVPRPQVDWYTAAAFINEITRRSIRQLDSERVKHIGQYLNLCESVLSTRSGQSDARRSGKL
jgi:aminoglycoside phosphotransferase (APT) family kinase protein